MMVTGICTICGGLAKPTYTCEMCGAFICKKCLNMDLMLCVRCSAQSRKMI